MAGYTDAISLLKTGPSRPTLYQVEVPFPTDLIDTNNSYLDNAKKHIRLFCSDIRIPGVSHDAVFLTGYQKMGVSRSVPVSASFGNGSPLQLNVIENSNWDTYRAMRQIWDRTAAPSGLNPQQGSANIRMQYYDDIVKLISKIHITKLELPRGGVGEKEGQLKFDREQDGLIAGYEKVCKITFHNTIPTAISDIELSSQSVDTPLSFRIGFLFETYSYDFNIYDE